MNVEKLTDAVRMYSTKIAYKNYMIINDPFSNLIGNNLTI